MQVQIDKKKRTSTSGSRSKSKKSANNIRGDQTVQLKPKPLHIFNNQDICAKIKTQNSLSVNKSKGSKKNSKSLKRPDKQHTGKYKYKHRQIQIQNIGKIQQIIGIQKSIKQNNKQSKDHSYLVSAQRKYSVNKINKTQITQIQNQDIYKKLYLIKKQLSKIKMPEKFSIADIQKYFNQIKQSFTNITIQPVQTIFNKLHLMYITPIQNLFDMIRPYQNVLRKKQEMSQMIKQQIQSNQKLYQQLDPQDIQIIKLKQKIQKNSQLIEQMKKKKKLQYNQLHNNQNQPNQQSNMFSMKKKKSPQSGNNTKFIDISKQSPLIQEKVNHQEYQKKLVKQYDKNPIFHNQKPSILKNETYVGKNSLVEDNNKTISQHELHFKQEDKISFEGNEKNQSDKQSDKHSEQNLQYEYIQPEIPQSQQISQNQQIANKMGGKSGGMSFSFKLDIPKIDRSNTGFHDQFYSKLDQFSQSWRNQALRQKRF